MNDIVLSTQNGEPVASSREIAKRFGKNHRDVLRAIEDILEGVRKIAQTPTEEGLPKNGDTPMFFKTEYTHPQNHQKYPMYLMNRDGFSLLAMGFTGKEAVQWKLKYIQAFNAMEQQLAAQHARNCDNERRSAQIERDWQAKLDARLSHLQIIAFGLPGFDEVMNAALESGTPEKK